MSARWSISARATSRLRRTIWFGTDNVGRDILTRVLFGYRISLILAATVLIFAVPVGVVLGLLAGYFGGWAETIIMRSNDIALAIPPLVMALAVTTVLTPSLIHSMLAIAALWWTWHTRLIFSIVRTLRQQEFVEAAKTLGASSFHILFRELLPNCASAILVKTSLDFGFVILVGAALSYLGLGVQPPTPDLGTMVATRRRLLARALVGGAVAGRRDPVRRARLQSARRRPARPLRRRERPMSEEPLLAVERLSLDFESEGRVAHILRDVSLDVPAHRHVALVGESGCGKSVTMRAIMGLLDDAAGKVPRRARSVSTARISCGSAAASARRCAAPRCRWCSRTRQAR